MALAGDKVKIILKQVHMSGRLHSIKKQRATVEAKVEDHGS